MKPFEIPSPQGTLRGYAGTKQKTSSFVVFVHGFERFGLEEKFRSLAKLLAAHHQNWIYFDQTGIGISDGNYNEHTLQTLVSNLDHIIDYGKELFGETSKSTISIVGHSLGAVLALKHIVGSGDIPRYKLVQIAPALDQHTLNRFWFSNSYNTAEILIKRSNREKYFNESDYNQFKLSQPSRSKYSLMNQKYFKSLEGVNAEKELQQLAGDQVLSFFGKKDKTIPLESIDLKLYPNHHIIEKGDHDMQNVESQILLNQAIVQFIKS